MTIKNISNETESIGWTSLEPRMYLHISDANVTEFLMVGVARADMQAANLLWVY